MYEYIKGIFIGINKDYVVIENNDIGYKIFISGNTLSKMPQTNEKVRLYLQQIVREDFVGLYGFINKEELDMFNLLININGVGPKAALSLLSICSTLNLKYAVLSGDEKTLIKAPGIGKKIAQRIILELKDKLNAESLIRNTGIDADILSAQDINSSVLSEALQALISLGYSEKEAEKALININKTESIENIIKNALKYLMN